MDAASIGDSPRRRPTGHAVAFALLVFGAATVPPAYAGTVLPSSTPGYVHESFGVEDGLPVAGILEVLQTRDGYLWLATFDGLVRFDGMRFEVFDGERVPALGSDRIIDLLEARDGTLWILSEQGHLARLTGGRFTACGSARGGPASCDLPEAGPAVYSALYEDPRGGLWVGGHPGLYRYSAGRLRRVSGFTDPRLVRALLADRSGRLWVGTRGGLWVGRAGGFEAVPLGSWRGREGMVSSIAEGPEGEIWVGIEGGAVGRIRSRRFHPVVEGGGDVVAGPDGGLWIAADDRLLRRQGRRLDTVVEVERSLHFLRPGRNPVVHAGGSTWVAWTARLLRDGRPVLELPEETGSVFSLLVDRAGTVWATSSVAGGLHAFHPARITSIVDGLPSPVVYPLYEDRDGTLWAGGYSLAVLPPDGVRFHADGLPPPPVETVLAILRDRAGRLWVGTEDRGLFTLEEGGYQGPHGPPALATTDVRALAQGAGGVLWVGTADGLFRREPAGRWTHFGPEEGLPSPKVRVIREAADGTLWLGTDGDGLIRYREGVFTTVDRTRGLSSDLVRAIWPAPDGRLWIATENRGLNRLDPATIDAPGGPEIAVVGRTQGLYSSGIHQIVDDGLGNLWMSSNQGIFRARLVDLDAVADGRRERLDCVAYTERDGMLNREANGGVQQAGLRDREGRIWFPTQAGVARVDPRRAMDAGPPPPIHVEGLLAGGEEVAVDSGPVRLSPHQRTFSVAFSAPSFRAPERLRFRYRLTPYDDGWNDADARREAYYTKVPPGRYTFVVAVNEAGAWSREPASLTLVVTPRFYETGWFSAAALVVVGGLGLVLARVRGARQRARRRALERLVQERTATIAEQADRLRHLDALKSEFFANVSHEFRTPLTLTLGPLRDALGGAFGAVPPQLAGQIELAVRNAERLLSLVDQLLDIARIDAGGLELRPERTDLAELLRLRVEAFLSLAERRRIDLSLLCSSDACEVVCDPAQLEKVFDNLLSNALKFTPEGGAVRVTLEALPESDRVAVAVRDNGPGIAADLRERVFDRFYQVDGSGRRGGGTGLGLALARQLVELHGGSVTADGSGGRGACFVVRLPREPEPLLEAMAARREEQTPRAGVPLPTPGEEEDGVPPTVGSGADDGTAERTTVLLVEDNPEVRAFVRRHLEPAYRVVEAAGGEGALSAARQRSPDLVISDVMMPGVDGTSLFRQLRQDPELALVPVILVTARASADERLESLRQGVDDYLVKPFDPHELRARVDNLIAARRRLHRRAGAPRGLEVSEIEATPADRAFLDRVQATIEERLDDSELSVERLAALLGCDRSHLLRRLRALIDETPSGLIRSLRLQRAAQLLRAGAGGVNEIAYAVGFKSVAHFSNAFLDRYGERPSAFAARHRNG